MTTTEVKTPMNTTRPDPQLQLGAPRVMAGLIDVALVTATVAPLAVIDIGLACLAGFILAAAYAALCEGGPSGQTLGKRLTGVRVIDARTGGPIGRLRALVRHFVRLPFLGFGELLFRAIFPAHRTWYDWAVRAVVVPAERSAKREHVAA
jgi:uncharacterized RDD family membrane protein YckC